MRSRTCYEILPESFRLIVLNHELSIQRALTALQANGIVSAPVYDGHSARFVGMFTLTECVDASRRPG